MRRSVYLSGDVLPVLPEDAAAQQHLAGDRASEPGGSGPNRTGPSGPSPVRHLLQVQLPVAAQQLAHVVAQDADEEGDEDDGQDDPHSDAGVQQELRAGHRF